MLQEFKKFAMRGNVIDMAVGIIMGAAFGKIVSSLVDDVIMPPIGMVVGNVDFSSLVFVLREATADAPAVTLKYGLFLNAVVNFLIVAFAVFLLVKQVNRLTHDVAPKPKGPTMKECPFCVSSIPIKATRCPQCTSELAPGDAREANV